LNSHHIRILTAFGSLAILFIFIIQIFWIKQAYDISETQFEQTINVALRQVAEKITEKSKNNFTGKNPVIKINPRQYVVEVRSEIDASLLDVTLKATLDYFNIKHDVEYSIYSCQSNALVYCNYIQNNRPQKEVTVTQLPKFEGLDYYFGVTFPHYAIVSLNNIPMWMVTSFVLVVLVVFILYALFVVFYQKSVTKLQKDFINNMTHEFKTPISTISIIQQAISDPDIIKTPQRLATYTQIIGDEIGRLNEQVEKVLHISNIEKRKVEMDFVEIDVHDAITKILFNLSHSDFEKEVILNDSLLAEQHTILGDKTHFLNVICNLIENGIKYSPEKADITVKTFNSKNHLHILISDKGEGIDKKEIKKIFDKFYRISKGNTHNIKGYGLGLYYVKQVAKAHNWDLKVESNVGKGTLFTIIIHQEN